jgi:acetylornithine deacetylase/succinyl-diaminopimelate desuccinylase-like protein
MPTSVSSVVSSVLARFRGAVHDEDARTLADQMALAEIPAPTAREERRASFMAAAFAAMGYEVERDRVGNVVAWAPESPADAGASPVVVCAHLDTVFGDGVSHRIARQGDRLVGPGIGDNARGLAGMLAIARVLRSRGRTRHPLLFAATVGEEGEGDLRGARHLFASRGAAAHAAFALDGAGDARIVTHALGTRRFRVAFRGAGGHSWAASDTPNPLHAAADLSSRLARLPLRATPRTTLAVTRIHGGDAVNAIPPDAHVDVEIRSPQDAVLDSGEGELRGLVTRALEDENARRGAARSPLTATIDLVSDRPAGVAPVDSVPVRAAVAATEGIGRIPEFAIASTDANVPLSLGIPAVTLGAGGVGGDTHTTSEWFENREGSLGLLRALAAILAAAGPA